MPIFTEVLCICIAFKCQSYIDYTWFAFYYDMVVKVQLIDNNIFESANRYLIDYDRFWTMRCDCNHWAWHLHTIVWYMTSRTLLDAVGFLKTDGISWFPAIAWQTSLVIASPQRLRHILSRKNDYLAWSL